MNRIALYPGTFDPFTKGHLSIVQRSLSLFDSIIVAVAEVTGKTTEWHLADRVRATEQACSEWSSVRVQSFSGLLIDCARDNGVSHVIRGVRSAVDIEHERSLADMNRLLSGGELETVFLIAEPEYASVSSTLVRDIVRSGGDPSLFVPPSVCQELGLG